MASTTFSGQLSLVDFTVDEVARIDPKSQFDPDTSTSIYKIEGVLKDNVEERHALCVWLQHSVHRFHDEDWNFSHLLAGPGILSLALRSSGKDARYKVGTPVSIKQR